VGIFHPAGVTRPTGHPPRRCRSVRMSPAVTATSRRRFQRLGARHINRRPVMKSGADTDSEP